MTRTCVALIAVFALSACGLNSAHGATLFWEGRLLDDVAGALDSNWDLGSTANWNDGSAIGAFTTWTDGNAAVFQDDGGGLNDNTSVVITGAGVSPTSITFNRGFNTVYTITGGDILTGSIIGTRDDTKNFDRDGSYSFGGGTFANAGASHFNYRPASPGTYQFGSGPITVQNGSFNFLPLSAATLTNDFFLTGSGSITGNANATFTGNLTISGNSITLPGSSPFPFPAITITQNTTFETTRCCGIPSQSQMTSDITSSGGPHNITLQGSLGANADWRSRVDAPATGWDVKDITKTGRTLLHFNGSMSNFFDGLIANGGTFYHRGGNLQFGGTTVDLNFRFMLDPVPAMVGVNPFETGSGFHSVSQLNINAGGVLGGNGTVAADNNLNGGLPTFESNVNVTVNNGGELSPGLSAGTLTIMGNLTMNSGSLLRIEVTGGDEVAGTDYDQLAVTGNITGLTNADLIVDFTGTPLEDLEGDVLTIITSANALTGEFNSVTFLGGYKGDITFGNGIVTLSNIELIVPEPNTALMLTLGACGMVWQGRRRRGQAGVRS